MASEKNAPARNPARLKAVAARAEANTAARAQTSITYRALVKAIRAAVDDGFSRREVAAAANQSATRVQQLVSVE